MENQQHPSNENIAQLSEAYIQDSFHSYLKSSLAQAKAERLLDSEMLSSAQGDLMITGPALTLYFAALRSSTTPPSVPLPRKARGEPPVELSFENCPPPFVSFLKVWALTVPHIQALVPEHQHDLARTICNLAPLSSPPPPILNRIAADLRAVAIEISQRRSFQEKYAGDLQAAIDAGEVDMRMKYKASFVPPPTYDEAATPSPSRSTFSSPNASPRYSEHHLPPSFPVPTIPRSPGLLSPHRAEVPLPSSPPRSPGHSRTVSTSSQSSSMSSRDRSPNSQLLNSDAPAIEFIRETLYASLADVIQREPSIRLLLKTDPPRAYYASVAFAILDVSRSNVLPDGAIIGVLGTPLTLAECPPPLRPFMSELAAIGHAASEMVEEDDTSAIEAIQAGQAPGLSRLDRVKIILTKGIGSELALLEREGAQAQSSRPMENGIQTTGTGRRSHESTNGRRTSQEQRRDSAESGRRSTHGRAVAFANRINALALGMTRLRAFRERQDEVFKVLSAITEE